MQQSTERLRNQISYSGKEKSTSKYVVWQYTLRKHKKKNTEELSSPPFHILCALVHIFPFPNMNRQLMKLQKLLFQAKMAISDQFWT